MDQDDLDAQRAVRASFRWLWVGFLLAIAGDAAFLLFAEPLIGVSIACNLVGATVLMTASYKVGEAESYPRYSRDFTLKRFRLLLIVLLLIAAMGAKALAGLPLPPADQEVRIFQAIIMYVLAPVVFLIGPGREYDEELTRTQFAQAMKIGYAVLLIAALAVIGVAIMIPALLMPVVAWGLYAGIAMPILAYVILDWRNDRNADV
jgi:hypothetical protein